MPTILVIDDDDDFRPMIVAALEERQFAVLEASDGEEGMDLALLHQPDLIIIDVNLGDANGFLVIDQLRENPRTSSIPFVLMSGIALGAGAWASDSTIDYLAKPFGVDELMAAVEHQLSSHA